MNAKNITTTLIWLAVLGATVIVATKVVGNVGKRAGASLPMA